MHWNLNLHSNCFQFPSNPSCCIMLAKLHRLIRTHTIAYHFITIWGHDVFPRTVHLKSTRIFTHLAECEELHAKVQQLAKSLNLEEWTNGKNENTSPGTLRSRYHVFPVFSSEKACGSDMTGSRCQHSLLGHLHPWLVPPVQQSIGRSWHTSQLFLFTCCQYSFNVLRFLLPCLLQCFAMCLHVSAGSRSAANERRSVRTCTYWILRFVHLKGLLPLCSRALVRRTSNKSECDYFHLHLALGWWFWKGLGWQRCSVIWCLLQLTVCSCRISARTVVRLSASRPTRQQDLAAGDIYSMHKNKYMSNMLHYTYFLCMHHSCSR